MKRQLRLKRRTRLIGFCRMRPREREASLAEIEKAIKMGLRGIKLHPPSDNFSPRHTDSILDLAGKTKLPVMLHTSHEEHSSPLTWEPTFA